MAVLSPSYTASGRTIAADGGGSGYVPGSGTSALRTFSTGSGSSSRGVSASYSAPDSLSSSLTAALDQIYKITERNTARSEAQAAELRDWQQRQNQIAMEFNSAEAAKNRDWQKMMSDTAHQREIRDLQAAGLNPVLSAMGGNGASVTSGATASGVTSAGSRGEVDTGLTQGLVSLLGTLWSAQTQLESQRINAQNNLAIAERNNSASQLVAEIYTQQSREASQLAAATQLRTSEISAAVSELVSRVSANAQYYSANIAHQNAILQSEASKVIADMQVKSNDKIALRNGIVNLAQSGLNFISTLRGQNMSAQSAKDVASIYYLGDMLTAQKYTDTQRDIANKNYSANIFGSIFRSLPFLIGGLG
ncbi:DNA pilot protein [Sigmofec virus UA08Rod_5894]|uniref:DNA pilot protein n=1 Tax=Sigmofec virus UA08Rod_5894 TaxID=2929443 RepID=A0A976N1X3_9VIRU|nr:DNA pilot protein [Sigmofec virus UA08Rod_5894]